MWPRNGRGRKLNLPETRIDCEGQFHSRTVRNDLHTVNLCTACAAQNPSAFTLVYRIPERKRNQNVERTCEISTENKLLSTRSATRATIILTLSGPRENNRRACRHGLVNHWTDYPIHVAKYPSAYIYIYATTLGVHKHTQHKNVSAVKQRYHATYQAMESHNPNKLRQKA